MPVFKMKAKSTTTCKRDGRYLHVSEKSNKISKIQRSLVRVKDEMKNLIISSLTSYNGGCSMVRETDEMDNLAVASQTSHNGGCSMVRVTDEMDNLAVASQTSHNGGRSMVRISDEMDNLAISSETSYSGGCSMVRVADEMANLAISRETAHNGGFFINEESPKEHDNEKNQMPSHIDIAVEQDCLSFNGCSDLVDFSAEMDSLPFSVPSSSDAMFCSFNRSDDDYCNLFESVCKEQITMTHQVDTNNFTIYPMPEMLNSYVDEASLNDFSSIFDDSCNLNTLSDIDFVGMDLKYEIPTPEGTMEEANYHNVDSCENFQPMPDASWFNLLCHQAKPGTEELDVRSSQLDSERVDYSDQEAFIKTVLEISDESNLLPALVSKETSIRKNVTLVLDLDETLVHSSMGKQIDGADFTIPILLDKEYTVYVRERPFLRDFLEKVSGMFEIIIFTASKSLYAGKLLDVLDPEQKLFSRRLYRESCILENGTYIKDLTVLGIDLAKVFIIDNSPQVFKLQVNNGIPIVSWYDDPSDSALMSLLPFLEKLVDVDDVRPIIAEKFGGPKNKFCT